MCPTLEPIEINAILLSSKSWVGTGLWHRTGVPDESTAEFVELFGTINMKEFELLGRSGGFPNLPPQLTFGTFGMGDQWLIPELYKPDGEPSKFVMSYFYGRTKSVLHGDLWDPLSPYPHVLEFTLFLTIYSGVCDECRVGYMDRLEHIRSHH